MKHYFVRFVFENILFGLISTAHGQNIRKNFIKKKKQQRKTNQNVETQDKT